MSRKRKKFFGGIFIIIPKRCLYFRTERVEKKKISTRPKIQQSPFLFLYASHQRSRQLTTAINTCMMTSQAWCEQSRSHFLHQLSGRKRGIDDVLFGPHIRCTILGVQLARRASPCSPLPTLDSAGSGLGCARIVSLPARRAAFVLHFST